MTWCAGSPQLMVTPSLPGRILSKRHVYWPMLAGQLPPQPRFSNAKLRLGDQSAGLQIIRKIQPTANYCNYISHHKKFYKLIEMPTDKANMVILILQDGIDTYYQALPYHTCAIVCMRCSLALTSASNSWCFWSLFSRFVGSRYDSSLATCSFSLTHASA